MKDEERATTIADLKGFLWNLTALNSPSNLPNQDRREIVNDLRLRLCPLIEYLSKQELSRISARYVYKVVKDLGWKKRRIGKKVSWHNPRCQYVHRG